MSSVSFGNSLEGLYLIKSILEGPKEIDTINKIMKIYKKLDGSRAF